MEDRKVYLCYDCENPDTPCIAVTDSDLDLRCLHGYSTAGWINLDPVLASGILSALADEQRGRC